MNISNIFILIPTLTMLDARAVDINPCAIPTSSIVIAMTDSMVADFDIPFESINRSKIEIKLIEDMEVNESYGTYLANEDYKNDKEHFVKLKEYEKIYTEYHPRNLITQISINNMEGKKNIFLASSIVNDDECSVRFNGYIIVKKEY